MAVVTFLDASVLIAAHRGRPEQRKPSLAILSQRGRSFVASPFLYLETVPKAAYHGNASEVEFFTNYFDSVEVWINDLESIVRIAREQAEICGLAAMDALHVAAAFLAGADVLYTVERRSKPIYRTSLVQVAAVGIE